MAVIAAIINKKDEYNKI